MPHADPEVRRAYHHEYNSRPERREAVRQADVRRRGSRSARNARLRYRFGIDLEDYERMHAEQAGLCAICHGETNGQGDLHVDHDHVTGKVRGLLCSRCNTGIGMMGDNTALLRKAIEYLEGVSVNG